MKCQNCHKENMRKANYCKYCGNKFSQREKDDARQEGLSGALRSWSDWYEQTTFQKITGHPFFQVSSILIVLAAGIYLMLSHGTKLNILESDNYKIEYNEEIKTYYVLLDKADKMNVLETALNLYIPNRIDNINVIYYNENNEIISTDKYSKDDEIIVAANLSKDNYYIISNADNRDEALKVYVYYEE